VRRSNAGSSIALVGCVDVRKEFARRITACAPRRFYAMLLLHSRRQTADVPGEYFSDLCRNGPSGENSALGANHLVDSV
jgi:hypothetical protein